jgi:hypothetical protein
MSSNARVAGQEDSAHPSATELTIDDQASTECFGDSFV